MLLDLTAPLIVPPTSTKAVYDFEMALIAVLKEVSEHLAIPGTFLHAQFPLPTIALLARAICYIAICSDERKLVVRLSSVLMRHCMYRYSGNVMHRVWDKLSERTFRSETTQRVVSTVRRLTAFYANSLTIPHGEEDFLCTDDLFSLLPNEDRHWFGIYFGRLLVEMPWFRVGQVGRPGVGW
jgi:hypothetical protein